MKRSLALLASLAFALGASTPALADGRPNYHASFEEPAPARTAKGPLRSAQSHAARGALLASPVSVTSWDRRQPGVEVPMFLNAIKAAAPPGTRLAPSSAPGVSTHAAAEAAARAHLRALANLYRLPPAALAAAVTPHVHDTGRGGVVVTLGQEVDGVEVFQQRMSVLLRRDFSLVAMGGNLHPAATPQTALGEALFVLDAREALSHALGDHLGLTLPVGSLTPRASKHARYRQFDLTPALASPSGSAAFSQPARVKKVFFPLHDRLLPAYYLELFTARSRAHPESAMAYVIAAEDGRVLYRADRIAYEAHNYRVWAETSGEKRPLDGPKADANPYPGDAPNGFIAPFIEPSLVSMDGFNKNPKGMPDPWLPLGATETRGNNVDAYTDATMKDGFSEGDVRASLTGPLTFDRVYDTSMEPDASVEQQVAALTQLFYTANWQHDWWYESGFNEASGNGQMDNYGRGGEDGDPMHVESQDASGFNNANMMTPDDGLSPRMQMYLYRGETRKLSVLPVSADLASGGAHFGPASFAVEGDVVLAEDGTAPVNNACEAITSDVAGKIALLDRGNCPYEKKVLNAEAAGAIGVLLANFLPGSEPPDLGGTAAVNIPVLSIRFEDGVSIKTALANGPVTANLTRVSGPLRDAALDNATVSHEWGHFLHYRLVPCSLNQCRGQGEGWGDFNALMLSVREGDDLSGSFGYATYAGDYRPNAAYFGNRRYPTSTDLARSPLTFKHIADGVALPQDVPTANQGYDPNAEVHNTGEIWASMLFEAYAGLIHESEGANARYTFAEARRRMADYIVMGMKLTPAEPTFTEQRDAILAAAAASDEADMVVMAKGFAKRGAGTCAVSPERSSEDNAGVEESFALAPVLVFGAIRLDDSHASCDADGHLDAGEKGTLAIEIANMGAAPLDDATLVVSLEGTALTLSATKVTVPSLAAGGKTQVFLEVEMPKGATVSSTVLLSATLESPSSCAKKLSITAPLRVNYDEAAASSTTDTFESETDLWTPGGVGEAWVRALDEAGNQAWHGTDAPALTDTWLESPALMISKTEPLVLSFDHRHSFEKVGGEAVDGGLIELTTNGGKVWNDLSFYGEVPYGGAIAKDAVNLLAGRKAFVGKNAAWPESDTMTIDLGTKLAGKTVNLRFRLATNTEGEDLGWWVDNVSLQGLADTPFPALTDNAVACPPDMEKPKPVDPVPTKIEAAGCSCTLAGGGESSGALSLALGVLAWLKRRRRSVLARVAH